MKSNSISKYAVGAAAIVGVAFSGTAAAETFNVNATVQNTLAITNVANMDLGTLFATSASSGVYKYMKLPHTGTFGSPAGHASLTLLSLGGTVSTAQASVAVGTTTPFTITLPDAEMDANPLEATGAVAAVIADLNNTAVIPDQILVDDTSNNPSVAYFQLVNFEVGTVTDGTAGPECADATDGAVTCLLTPAFGAAAVAFNIGATIVTDTSGTTTYQATTYTGSFDVTASY